MVTVKQISTTDDLEKIVADIKNAIWVPASEIEPNDYTVEGLKRFLNSPESVFIIASLHNQFAGMASAKVLNRPNGDTWLYVDEIDVCRPMQKKGVGKALMQHFITLAKQLNCDEVWLGTEPDNTPADKLYRSLQPDDVQSFIGYTFLLAK